MTPDEVVAAQLAAYNARDLDTFMSYWHEDARYLAYPDEPLALGVQAIRERHRERFGDPALEGRLIHRAVVGDLVVDHELVTRTFADGVAQLDVIALYEVRDGRIATATFAQSAARPTAG